MMRMTRAVVSVRASRVCPLPSMELRQSRPRLSSDSATTPHLCASTRPCRPRAGYLSHLTLPSSMQQQQQAMRAAPGGDHSGPMLYRLPVGRLGGLSRLETSRCSALPRRGTQKRVSCHLPRPRKERWIEPCVIDAACMVRES
jgi:hypothetical protein